MSKRRKRSIATELAQGERMVKFDPYEALATIIANQAESLLPLNRKQRRQWQRMSEKQRQAITQKIAADQRKKEGPKSE